MEAGELEGLRRRGGNTVLAAAVSKRARADDGRCEKRAPTQSSHVTDSFATHHIHFGLIVHFFQSLALI